jgi:hypothetical protein
LFLVAMASAHPAVEMHASEIEESPLAPRSGPRGATLFAGLDSSQTGIVTENRYDDPAMWAQRYAEFATGAVGTGVAIGDYDNDGWPDVFVVSKTERCRLFRNLGGWKFEDVTERAGVGDSGDAARVWKQGATFADLNNDGLLDLYVCRSSAPNLLYMNRGDGTFGEEAAARGLDVNDRSVMAAFHDYDRDGWLDVFVQTNWPESTEERHDQRNRLFRNDGNGFFTDVTDRAGIKGKSQGHSAIWWDFEEDGWPDLYVANDFTPPDQFYRNNRDGTFTNVIDSVVPHTPFSSMGADLGDVNNDGHIDLLVADMAATTHEKDQRTMANARSLIVDSKDGAMPFAMRNALYLGTGTSRVLEAACLVGLEATDWTWSVRFEDLDNDGRLDLHVTNGMYREPHNADLMARVAQAQTLAEKVRIEKASPVLRERNLAFRNLGDLRFEEMGAAWGMDENGVSFGAAFGDLDRDGDLDLVYTNYKKGATVLRNDSQIGHRVIVALRGKRTNRFGIGATVRLESASGIQVRALVLARGVLSSSDPVLHFGLGDDAMIDRLAISWPDGSEQVFTNLAADRRYTIAEPSEPNPQANSARQPLPRFTEVLQESDRVLAGRKVFGDELPRQPLLPIRHDRAGPPIAVGDLNGDGHDEILIGGTPSVPARVIVNAGDGMFQSADMSVLTQDSILIDGPLIVFDADGDGDADLMRTRAGSGRTEDAEEYQPDLFLNDGRGDFRMANAGALPPLPINAGAVAAADFNRDGRVDVFIGGRLVPGRYPTSPRSAILANRGGRFEDVTVMTAPELERAGMVTAAIWSDVDLDGWPDLVVAMEWGTVRYFHNKRGEFLEDWSERAGFASAGSGWWTSLAAADFNGDGRPDFVAGNAGLNTPYRADRKHPALLFAGAFGDGDEFQLIEGYYEGDRVLPRRSRRELGAIMPEILNRFPRNDRFARATLREIFGDERLSAATRFSATELRSGIFLSDSDGGYRFSELPRLAQIAPLQGVIAADFDGDGFADICAVQNSATPPPSIGAFDGGLGVWLRGDGKGNFTTVPPAESGFLVPGFPGGTVPLDKDGGLDLAVSR